jgi:hypothetical protein
MVFVHHSRRGANVGVGGVSDLAFIEALWCSDTYLLTLYATSGVLSRKATHCPVRRKSVVRTAWAMYSGRVN